MAWIHLFLLGSTLVGSGFANVPVQYWAWSGGETNPQPVARNGINGGVNSRQDDTDCVECPPDYERQGYPPDEKFRQETPPDDNNRQETPPVDNNRQGSADRNKITFPNRFAPPEIPETCKGSTFCESIPNYPTQTAEAILTNLGEMVTGILVDKLDVPDTPAIVQRVGGAAEDNQELCNFENKVVYPQAAQGSDGLWYTMVNRPGKPVQGFKVEICQQNGGSCSKIALFHAEYVATCRQKYVLRTALVIDNDGDGNAIWKDVRLPSCCSCVAKYVAK